MADWLAGLTGLGAGGGSFFPLRCVVLRCVALRVALSCVCYVVQGNIVGKKRT